MSLVVTNMVSMHTLTSDDPTFSTDRATAGVFPLKGKLLNVRDAKHEQLMNNEEIKNIQQIMGLQHGKVTEEAQDHHVFLIWTPLQGP